MIKISDEDKKFILKHVENVETLLKGESKKDLQELLDELNFITIYNMDESGVPDALGNEAQRVFDRIYLDN